MAIRPPDREPTEATVVRPATVDDVEALIALRIVMFQTSEPDPGPAGDRWQRACRQILLDGFAAGDLIGPSWPAASVRSVDGYPARPTRRG